VLEFYRKYKLRIIMLSPIVIGLGFFLFSAISALITVKNSKIPENFDKVTLNISDFSIKQIDPTNNQTKWILKGAKTEANSDQTKATIHEPFMIFYENGVEKFNIKSKIAYLDKAKQNVDLQENVVLTSKDGKYQITAGRMLVDESSKYIEYQNNWQIVNSDGYEILGETGAISRDLKEIVSKTNARLRRKEGDKKFDLSANQIILLSDSEQAINATGSAVMLLGLAKTLKAETIIIKKSGAIDAQGSVEVETEKIRCNSQKLVVVPKADKNPKTALFTGTPRVLQNNKLIYADKVKYDFDTELVEIEGHVRSN